MPEAVGTSPDEVFSRTCAVQLEILKGYERDIPKHFSRTETKHAHAAWRPIPAHLGRKNKKFVFSHIAEGFARGTSAPVSHGSPRQLSRRPGIPIVPHADNAAFKLVLVDVGLLGVMA